MFERFTDRTWMVYEFASEEARMLGHAFVGTEHLLLGLLREGESIAFSVLQEHNLELEPVRRLVQAINESLEGEPTEDISLTSRAEKTLTAMALREAHYQGQNFIAPEHVLLALTSSSSSGVHLQVLGDLGIDVGVLRAEVIEVLHPRQ